MYFDIRTGQLEGYGVYTGGGGSLSVVGDGLAEHFTEWFYPFTDWTYPGSVADTATQVSTAPAECPPVASSSRTRAER
jgi:hypothetical protein